MKELVARAFGRFVKQFETLHSELETVIQCVTGMDVIPTKASIAKKYKYCKPVLVESEKSFVEAKQLRHALIEQFQTSELYVANDVALGRESWLFVRNQCRGQDQFDSGVGDCGDYGASRSVCPVHDVFLQTVPNLVYSDFGATTICSKDCPTFAVEMSELRTILKMSNAHSLILGDELCSGTETQSAISIFVAGIQHLQSEKK